MSDWYKNSLASAYLSASQSSPYIGDQSPRKQRHHRKTSSPIRQETKSEAIFWEKSSVLDSAQELNCLGEAQIRLQERTLRLAHTIVQQANETVYYGFFLGHTSQDEDEIVVSLNRFDPGRQIGDRKLPTSPLPGEFIVPVALTKRDYSVYEDNNKISLNMLKESCKTLYSDLIGNEQITSSRLCGVVCAIEYDAIDMELCTTIQWHMITSGLSFQLHPVNSLNIIPTALARNLSGPLVVNALQGQSKFGYLTMDQSRQLLLLLRSDPKVTALPLIGPWVSGINSLQNLDVWAACVRYISSTAFKDRVCDGKTGFLLLAYLNTQRQPSFFECTKLSESTQFTVLTSQESVNLFLDISAAHASAFIRFDLSRSSQNTEIFNSKQSQQPSQPILRQSSVPNANLSSLADLSKNETSIPRPSNHQFPDATPSVPDLSLFDNESERMQQKHSKNLQESVDLGFFSKSNFEADVSQESTSSVKASLASQFNVISSENMSKDGASHISNKNILSSSDACKITDTLEEQKKQFEALQSQIAFLLETQKNLPPAPLRPQETSFRSEGMTIATVEQNTSPHTSVTTYTQAKSPVKTMVSMSTNTGNSLMRLNSIDDANTDYPSQVDLPSFVDSETASPLLRRLSSCHSSPQLGDSVSVLQQKQSMIVENSPSADCEMKLKELAIKLQAALNLNLDSNSSNGTFNDIPSISSSVSSNQQKPLQFLENVSPANQLSDCNKMSLVQSSQSLQFFEINKLQSNQSSDCNLTSSLRSNKLQSNLQYTTNCPGSLPSSDLSMEANAIALKYLSNSQLAALQASEFNSDAILGEENSLYNNFKLSNVSMATAKYLERHGLAEPNYSCASEDASNILDLNRLRALPKLL